MNIKFNKKEKIILVVYLFVILILGAGITYSFFLLADRAKEDSTKVYAGKLDVNYIEGSQVIADILYPIPEPNSNVEKDVYKNRFTVSSEGTLEQNISINFQVSRNEFSKDAIKYALYDGDGTKLATGYLNQGMVTLIDNLYFKEVESRDFVLILWLQETPEDQSIEQGNKLAGRIVIQSKQYGY